MQADKEKNQILHYFKFGCNAFFDSFNQTTLVVVSITLPIAVIAYAIQPEISSIIRVKSDISYFLIFKWLFSQAILRVVSTFVFILVILRLEIQRRGEEVFWDFALAFTSLKGVILIDFTYYFGLQIFIVLVLVFINLLVASLLGISGFTLLLSFSLVIFAAIVPFVRFYFCTFYALLKRSTFKDSFKRANLLSKNSEIKIFKLVAVYYVFTVFLLLFLSSFFGSSVPSQIILHTLVSVLFVPYCYAGYSLFFDLEERHRISKD
ncbi:MAG: hypothetical protein VX794_04885 [Nitrospinota bacterium]|nr:hypothetical protein [Nitrospinota bacterium]